MRIDCHIHVVPPALPGVGSLSPILRSNVSNVAVAIKREMQLAGIDQVLAMGEYRCTDTDPLGVTSTLAIAERVPGLRVIGICDPLRGDDILHLKRVETMLADPRVAALKCYLGYLHYEPAHAGYRRYYELAGMYKKPVIFHTGDTYSAQAKLKYALPVGVDEVAVDHPETKFVLAHLGNPWMVEAAEVIYKNINVWADLSGLLVGEDVDFASETVQDVMSRLRAAFRFAERPNRFVFGTDWPLIPIAAYAEFVRRSIPAEFHELVFSETPARLFGLGEPAT
jgi:uncharacterized protein